MESLASQVDKNLLNNWMAVKSLQRWTSGSAGRGNSARGNCTPTSQTKNCLIITSFSSQVQLFAKEQVGMKSIELRTVPGFSH